MSVKYSVEEVRANVIRERANVLHGYSQHANNAYGELCRAIIEDLNAYAERIEADESAAWRDGAPSKPWSSEWFIAIMESGDRVVLRELPDEYTYDFTTADDTYVKRERIKRWMQFPDSQFTYPPAQAAQVDDWRDRYASLCSRIGMDPYKWNGTNGYSEDEVWYHIKELENHAPTNPHSPDAADSGRVDDTRGMTVEKVRDHLLRKVAYYEDEQYPRMKRLHQQMADCLTAALAAQGQGDVTLIFDNVVVPERRQYLHRVEDAQGREISLGDTPCGDGLTAIRLHTHPAPPASPAGVLDGWHARRDDDMRAWFVQSPTGDVCEVHDRAVVPYAEVLRQLAQDLAAAPSATPEVIETVECDLPPGYRMGTRDGDYWPLFGNGYCTDHAFPTRELAALAAWKLAHDRLDSCMTSIRRLAASHVPGGDGS